MKPTLYNFLNKYLFNDINRRCYLLTADIANDIRDGAKERATLDSSQYQYQDSYYKYKTKDDFVMYMNNFKCTETRENDGTYTCTAYNPYKVYWKKKGMEVPFGNFIEYGTGTIGYISNASGKWDWGDYTHYAWDDATTAQFKETGLFGMTAHPHWQPSKEYVRNNLSKYSLFGEKYAGNKRKGTSEAK